MDADLLEALLAPIPGEHIAGEDLSFAPELDEIREARREDDASLDRGEWQAPLKVADWPRVASLCERLLRERSKDLQVAAWYAEAQARLNGFPGLTLGLRLMDGLITDFWEFAYPAFDPDDLDERSGKVEWLNHQLAQVVRTLPLTRPEAGGYGWLHWDQSRQVENLGLKDPEARQRAIDAGKLSGEAFDRAARLSGLEFYRRLRGEIAEAGAALSVLEDHVDERFGAQGPSLKGLRAAVQDCAAVVERLLMQLGDGATKAAAPAVSLRKGETTISAHVNDVPVVPSARTGTEPASRDEAVAALRAVARYFRVHEPHSPVALLAERAARWAEMPLETWLASVIKDEATLNQLRELLDIRDAG